MKISIYDRSKQLSKARFFSNSSLLKRRITGLNRLLLLFRALSCFAISEAVHAQEPVSKTEMSPAIITEHVVWRFSETKFVPPIKVEPLSKSRQQRSTPEQAAVTQFSAIKAFDEQWWGEGWDAVSQAKLGFASVPTSVPKEAQSIQNWKANWHQLENTTTFLIAKAETPDFVIIAYETRKDTAKSPIGKIARNVTFDEDGVIRNRLCFVREGNQWLSTNRFSLHPILQLWYSEKGEVTKVGDFGATNLGP